MMSSNLALIVEESPVKSGGRSRVNLDTLKQMDLNEGELVVLSSSKKDILVTLYSDKLISYGKIKVRKQDAKKLGVKEGDEIRIKQHQNLLKSLL
ncbi:MAG: hypothetical protein ACOCSL_03685 [Thermoplasmatota archaeon]